MWQIKQFKTADAQAMWMIKNAWRYQIVPLFVNNGYAVEYRRLRRVY